MVVRTLAPRRRAPGDDLRGAGSRVGAPPGRADRGARAHRLRGRPDPLPRTARARPLRGPDRPSGRLPLPVDRPGAARPRGGGRGGDRRGARLHDRRRRGLDAAVRADGRADERPARAEPHDPPPLRSAAVGARSSAHRRSSPREGVPPQGGRSAARAAPTLPVRRDVRRPPRGVGAVPRRRRVVRAFTHRRPRRARLGAAAGGDCALRRAENPDDRPPARDRDDLRPTGLRREHPAGADARARPRRLRGPRRRGLRPSRRCGQRVRPPGGRASRPDRASRRRVPRRRRAARPDAADDRPPVSHHHGDDVRKLRRRA